MREVALRIQVYKNYPVPLLGQTSPDVGGGSRLPNSPFLIRECDDFTHTPNIEVDRVIRVMSTTSVTGITTVTNTTYITCVTDVTK
ncbi:hypothetical protein GCM10027348_42100 [Hymenobacter tenuis]